jgi:type II secretory pathway pseudopilin PulG
MRHRGLRSARLQVTNHKLQIPQRGYMMITLMLALAMITLAMLAVLPGIKQQIMRDREEEMMHRGNSYMRAIQHFYKKFGRYPARVEELENTNNLRFLRKRYTDPMNVDPVTHKERPFKFLTQVDISLNNGPVLGQPAGQSGSGAQSGPLGQSGFGGSTFGSPQSGPGSFGAQPGGAQQTSTTTPASASSDSGSSSSNSSSTGSSSSPNTEEASTGPGSSSTSSSSSSSSGPNGQTFGGGPILGVASTSKAKTIRVFFDKNHYNDWFFIYMPMADVGGLLTGPINPNGTMGAGGLTPGLTPGATPGQGGLGQSGFGQGLGQGSTPNGGQTPILQPAPQQAPQQ